MPRLKVGAIDYLNTLPFFAALSLGELSADVELVPGVPTALNSALRRGEVDISLVSSIEYLNNKDRYELIPEFCIGAYRRVLSVCLYVQGAVEQIDNAVIGVTAESASSVALLRVLCHHFWGVTPTLETFVDLSAYTQYQALLLIGDASLLNPTLPGYNTIDLARAWSEETQLPFTFGVLAATKDVIEQRPDEVNAFCDVLERSLQWAEQHPDAIIDIAAKQCSVSRERLADYFDALKYRTTPQQKQGLDRFEELYQALPQLTEAAS